MIERPKLRHHLLCKYFWQHIPFRYAFAHVHDSRVTPLRIVLKTREPVVVILHRLERLEAGAAGELPDHKRQRPELIYRHQVLLETKAFQPDITIPFNSVVAELGFFTKGVAVDSAEAVFVVLIELPQLFAECRGDVVVQRIVVPRVTGEGGLDGVKSQVVLMVVGHKGVHQSDVVGLPCFGCVTRQHSSQRQQRTNNRRYYHDDMDSLFGYLQNAKKRVLTRVATAHKIVPTCGTSQPAIS